MKLRNALSAILWERDYRAWLRSHHVNGYQVSRKAFVGVLQGRLTARTRQYWVRSES